MRRGLQAFVVALALVGAAPLALAQHPENPEHPQEPGHSGTAVAEHGEQAHEGGFHHPAPMNWFDPTPETRRVAHGGEVEEVKGPPPFIGPLINFAVLVALGYMAVRRMINPALASRRAAMETEIAEAHRLHTEAQAMHKEYTERLASVDREIAVLKTEFAKAGEVERDRMIAEARTRAARLREEGEHTIEQELKVLREELRRDALTAAVAAAEQAIRKGIHASDHARLADEYIRDLSATGQKGAQA